MPSVLFDLTILATETRLRGIGRYVAELARALERTAGTAPSPRVRFLERTDWLGGGSVSDDATASLERLGQRASSASHYAWAYRQRVGMARAVRSLHPDLVHVGYAHARPLGYLGCPRVVTCHDLIPLRFSERYSDWREGWGRGRRWLDWRRYHGANHVIAISEETASDLVRLLGVSPRKISIVPNGIDLQRWSAEKQPGDRAALERVGLSSRPFFIYAGDADWRKNASGMLNGLARALPKLRSNEPVLAWAGKLSPERSAEVLGRARELGVECSLLLLGYVPDPVLHALYRGALATLFVSRAEGFGYPVLEAMALGCPVITSNRSSPAEIAGDAALLVDPEDHDAIAEAIVTLAGSAQERSRLTLRGRKRARLYSLERQGRETRRVYQALV